MASSIYNDNSGMTSVNWVRNILYRINYILVKMSIVKLMGMVILKFSCHVDSYSEYMNM